MWRELLTPLPHVHRILRLFFSLCIYFASHCRSLHPIWKCLFSFTINFAEIWHMSLTEDLKCFLQQAVRDWLRTKANLRAVRVWTKPECLLLPCVFFSPKCYSWSLGGDRGAPPALPQPGTTSHMVRVREELTVLNTVTAFAQFLLL